MKELDDDAILERLNIDDELKEESLNGRASDLRSDASKGCAGSSPASSANLGPVA